jgi:glycosyltransferase involved in cell wall biosynthesis
MQLNDTLKAKLVMNSLSQLVTPRISVVIPVFNVADYVEAAIASIQNQTIHDLEIIVVNNGSTDRTPQLIEKLAQNDPRMRILNTAESGGYGSTVARNLGFTACRAPYIAVMDGDDISVPDRLEKQLKFLTDHPEISIVSCGFRVMNERGQISERAHLGPPNDRAISKTCTYQMPCNHFWLAKRIVYEQLGGYRRMLCSYDYDFVLRALSSGFRISNIPEPLICYRFREGNTLDRMGFSIYRINRYLVRLYRERIAHGNDSFDPSALTELMHANQFLVSMHSRSIQCSRRGINSQTMVIRYFWKTMSYLIAPWKLRLSWYSFLTHLVYKFEGNNAGAF